MPAVTGTAGEAEEVKANLDADPRNLSYNLHRISPITSVNDLGSDFVTSFPRNELYLRALVSRARNTAERTKKKIAGRGAAKGDGKGAERERGERSKRVAGDKSN